MGKAQHAVFSGGHDGFSTRSGTREFVQGQEGCSSCSVFSEPTDGIGGILVGFDHDGSHAAADGGGQGNLMRTVLWCTEFGHRSDDSFQFLIVSGGDDGAGTSRQSFRTRLLFHLRFSKRKRSFRFTKFDLDAGSVLGQLCFGTLCLCELERKGFSVVFRCLIFHFLETKVEFTKGKTNLFALLLGFGQLVADQIGLNGEFVHLRLCLRTLLFVGLNDTFGCGKRFGQMLVLFSCGSQCIPDALLFCLRFLEFAHGLRKGIVCGFKIGNKRIEFILGLRELFRNGLGLGDFFLFFLRRFKQAVVVEFNGDLERLNGLTELRCFTTGQEVDFLLNLSDFIVQFKKHLFRCFMLVEEILAFVEIFLTLLDVEL